MEIQNNKFKEKLSEEKKYKHHVRFWKFIRKVARPIICRLFNFQYLLYCIYNRGKL